MSNRTAALTLFISQVVSILFAETFASEAIEATDLANFYEWRDEGYNELIDVYLRQYGFIEGVKATITALGGEDLTKEFFDIIASRYAQDLQPYLDRVADIPTEPTAEFVAAVRKLAIDTGDVLIGK